MGQYASLLRLVKVEYPADNVVMWPEQQPTEILLKQAIDGDDSAVNQLMDRHRNSLRQLIKRSDHAVSFVAPANRSRPNH